MADEYAVFKISSALFILRILSNACFTRTLAMFLIEGKLLCLLFTKSSTKECLKTLLKVSSKQAVGYWVSCRAKQRHNASERVGLPVGRFRGPTLLF